MVSKKLQHEINLTRPHLEKLPWEDPKFYGWWLSQTYHYVKYTTRSLYLSAGSTRFDDDLLFNFFVGHIKEEHGHEKICLVDLKNLGQPLSEECAEIRCVYREALDAIANKDVCYEIGYMMFFENLVITCGPGVYDRVAQAFPKNCSHFLKLHVQEDVEHVNKTNEFLMNLSEKQLETIEYAIENSSKFYRQALEKGLTIFTKTQTSLPLKIAA